jgi:hypothetical protein
MSNKLIGVVAFLFIALFYLFQIRPSNIKKECSVKAVEAAQNLIKTRAEIYYQDYDLTQSASKDLFYKKDYDSYYSRCLDQKGF